MARVTFNGDPGTSWSNETGKVQYQLVVDWHNSCGLCAQYDHAIGPWFPIPFHRGCRCKQRPVWPGETSDPFVDFREKVRELDRPRKSRVIGAANLKLVEEGVVKWEDVVTSGRVRTLQEVVSREKLSVDQMVKAGVPRKTAEKTHAGVNTSAHVHAEAQRRAAVQTLKDLGVGKLEIKRRVAEKLVERVAIAAGPSGPTKTATASPAGLAHALGVRFKNKPGDPRRNIARAVAIAGKEGIAVDPNAHDGIKAARGGIAIDDIAAAYHSGSKSILVNPRHPYWNDPAASIDRASKDGWISSSSPDHTIIHEMAHALHDRAIGTSAYRRLPRTALPPDLESIARRVSRYAKSNAVEFVAEVFAGLKGGAAYDSEVMALYAKLKGPRP